MTIIKRLPPIWLLVLCSAIGPVAMTITQPAAGHIMAEFSSSYGVAQLVITVYLVATACSALVLGPLSDRFGRRPVMIGGLGLFFFGSIVCIISPSLEVLLVGRFIQGCGGAVGMTLSRAIIRDVRSMEESASLIGYINMAMVVAPMIGPMLGGLLTETESWRLIFALLALYSALIVIAVCKKQNETATRRKISSSGLLSALPLFANRQFSGNIINLMFASGMFFAFIGGAPYIVIDIIGANPSEYGYYFAISAFGYLVGNLFTGRYAIRFGPDKMLVLAMCPTVIGIGLFWALCSWMHPLAIFVPMFFITLANGLTVPNATAVALSIRPEVAGAASGIVSFTQVGGGALLSLIAGFGHGMTRVPLLIMLSFCAVMSISGLMLSRMGR